MLEQAGRLGRRGVLLGGAGLALPGLGVLGLGVLGLGVPARAQPAPVPPSSEPQIAPAPSPPPGPPPLPTVTVQPLPPRPALGAPDRTKTYYVFFDQPIDLNSMRALRRQLALLVDAGVSHIVLVISSLGGLLLETLVTYSFIRSLPVLVQTHAQGMVASAATALFLAGQDRSADRGARFLFHPFTASLAGVFNAQQSQDQLQFDETMADAFSQIYQERSALTPDLIRQFNHGQFIYTADQAKGLGVVQTVADLKLPPEQSARILLIE